MNDKQQNPGSTGQQNGTGDYTIQTHVKSRSTWLRLFFMIVFVFVGGIARIVTVAVVVVQFFWVLLTGDRNQPLLSFGQSLATFVYQIVRYLTFNTEERPFPFDLDWPAGPPAS
jgi:Flp pilus assembly protein TadB